MNAPKLTTEDLLHMLAQGPNLFYVIGLPVALMVVSGIVSVALYKGLERILRP